MRTGISLIVLPAYWTCCFLLGSQGYEGMCLGFCILLCQVQLTSLGGMFYSEGKRRSKQWIWGKEKGVGLGGGKGGQENKTIKIKNKYS